MTLDPAWYNALVDDTGSGTVGTVWNKAAISGLINNINSEIGRMDLAISTWIPTITSAGGGTASYSNQAGLYARVSQRLAWIGFRIIFTKGSLAAGALSLHVPFYVFNSGSNFGGVVIPFFQGLATPVSSIGSYSAPGGDTMALQYVAAAGGVGTLNLSTADLGAGSIDFMGSGVYVTV